MVLSLDRWLGKVAIVTGTSSGIGEAIAERLVIEGLHVVGLARRIERLDKLAQRVSDKKGKFYPIQTDLTKEEDILNAFKWVKQNLGPVHILINNAGCLIPGNLREGDTKSWRQTFQVNVIALCIATREAIKDMRANNVDGHIIHVNSIGGHRIPRIPWLNVYPGSKYAVTALAETLRLELNSQKSKIKITSLSPGTVQTEILPDEFWTQIDGITDGSKMLDLADVADAAVYILSTPPHVQIQELTLLSVDESN